MKDGTAEKKEENPFDKVDLMPTSF